jgi:hypothetical protein
MIFERRPNFTICPGWPDGQAPFCISSLATVSSPLSHRIAGVPGFTPLNLERERTAMETMHWLVVLVPEAS